MSRTTYFAKFSDGATIKRTTVRVYTVAWRATWTDPDSGVKYDKRGFGASAAKLSPEKPNCPNSWHGTSPAGRARSRAENAEYLKRADYVVEVVPAVSL